MFTDGVRSLASVPLIRIKHTSVHIAFTALSMRRKKSRISNVQRQINSFTAVTVAWNGLPIRFCSIFCLRDKRQWHTMDDKNTNTSAKCSENFPGGEFCIFLFIWLVFLFGTLTKMQKTDTVAKSQLAPNSQPLFMEHSSFSCVPHSVR